MAVDHAVIQRVIDSVFKVLEEPEHIACSADAEPDRRDRRTDRRNDEEGYQEVISPPPDRPFVENIPHQHHHDRDEELVDYGVGKYAPCDHFIAFAVFGSDSDESGKDIFHAPLEHRRFAFTLDGIFAAVKHPVKVERLFTGQP